MESKSSYTQSRREISELREHVVQIEALLAYVLLITVGLFVASSLAGSVPALIWLAPAVALAGWQSVLRVTNPSSDIRDRLSWAATFGGFAGGAAGAAADIFTGGLSAGQGTALGMAGGAAVGGAFGKWIQSWGRRDELMERGAAFKFLYEKEKRSPRPIDIDHALDQEIPRFDINRDGRWWYKRADLEKFLIAIE